MTDPADGLAEGYSEGNAASTARRSFMGRLLSGLAALTTVGAGPVALRSAGAQQTSELQSPRDDWMKAFKGKHRTAFDMSAHKAGKPLTQAKNYLDAWRDAFTTPERDLNLVVGLHGDAIPVALTDALWVKFKIGEQYDVTDGGTKAAAVRNVFSTIHATAGGLVTPEQSVEGLQRRGVQFLVCRNTIEGATRKLSAAGFGTADDVRAALIGGLLPGLTLVPSMVVTLTQLQERGFQYIKVAT
jgi:intracellular sulfur oxidation DsrE/DsrF family protein